MGDSRISQLGLEAAFTALPRRISQIGLEAAIAPLPRRISQLGLEAAFLSSDIGWVPFTFTETMRFIGSATRDTTSFTEASLDALGRSLDEALVDCPTGVVDKGKVDQVSIIPGAVSTVHSFNEAGTINLNQSDGALLKTHELSFTLDAAREVQIFTSFIAKSTNVAGDHMLVQAEFRRNSSVLISKSVILTVAKANIDHLGGHIFSTLVPLGTTEYTVHMNINDSSVSPTIRERLMFARDIKV